jgi:transposase
LALLVSREFHIPLFHEAYPGNRPDAPEFSRVVDELAARQKLLEMDCEQITVVFDKGNNSQENLQKLGSFHFVGSLVPTQHEDLLGIELKEFQPLQGSGLEGLTAYRTEKKVLGRALRIVMTHNPELFAKQWRGLQWHMAKCEQRLKDLEGKLTRWREGQGRGKRPNQAGTLRQIAKMLHPRHMKQIFRVQAQKTPEGLRLEWSRDESELTRLKEHLFGRTIIFTDQKEWTNEQIVLGYRGQYQIEQAFHWMKAPEIARWWPMHHWTDGKIRVHAFYCVLALTLLSLLRRELVRRGYDWGVERILQVLGKIREVRLNGATYLSQLDPDAKKVYEQLKLNRYRESCGLQNRTSADKHRLARLQSKLSGCGKSR